MDVIELHIEYCCSSAELAENSVQNENRETCSPDKSVVDETFDDAAFDSSVSQTASGANVENREIVSYCWYSFSPKAACCSHKNVEKTIKTAIMNKCEKNFVSNRSDYPDTHFEKAIQANSAQTLDYSSKCAKNLLIPVEVELMKEFNAKTSNIDEDKRSFAEEDEFLIEVTNLTKNVETQNSENFLKPSEKAIKNKAGVEEAFQLFAFLDEKKEVFEAIVVQKFDTLAQTPFCENREAPIFSDNQPNDAQLATAKAKPAKNLSKLLSIEVRSTESDDLPMLSPQNCCSIDSDDFDKTQEKETETIAVTPTGWCGRHNGSMDSTLTVSSSFSSSSMTTTNDDVESSVEGSAIDDDETASLIISPQQRILRSDSGFGEPKEPGIQDLDENNGCFRFPKQIAWDWPFCDEGVAHGVYTEKKFQMCLPFFCAGVGRGSSKRFEIDKVSESSFCCKLGLSSCSDANSGGGGLWGIEVEVLRNLNTMVLTVFRDISRRNATKRLKRVRKVYQLSALYDVSTLTCTSLDYAIVIEAERRKPRAMERRKSSAFSDTSKKTNPLSDTFPYRCIYS